MCSLLRYWRAKITASAMYLLSLVVCGMAKVDELVQLVLMSLLVEFMLMSLLVLL